MPNRIVRDGILTSPRIAALGWAEETFYRRLMSVVDDYGRYFATPMLLRAACYPAQLDKVSDSDIGKWLLATEKAGLVRVYPASDGKRYVVILDFGQRIQAKSKFPDPIDDPLNSTVTHGDPPLNTVDHRLVVVEDGVEVEGVKGTRPRRKKPETFPLPDDFGISERVRAWATKNGHVKVEEHLESFRRKARARGYVYADWDDAFMEAIRENWAKIGSPNSTVINGETRRAPAKREFLG